MSAAAAPEGLVGKTIDGLEIRALLGRGGMGEVYKAWDPKLERLVALKIVSEQDAKDREFAVRFEREARAVSGLSHPNIAHVYSTGRHQGRPYYVMEFVDGRSLADILDSDGRISGLKCLDYLKQAAEGLRAAWEQGVIHRDIKPDNLMVDAKGRVKIVDFGLARRLEGDVKLTQTSMVVGTPRYMSPEQAVAGHVDHRSDIYSLGACFYHLFAGEAPFDAETPVALMMKHVGEPLTPLKRRQPNVPQGIAAIVERMLAKRQEERYQSYDELLHDIDAARAGRLRGPAMPTSETLAVTPSRPGQTPPAEQGSSSRALPVLFVVVGLVAFGALAMNQLRKKSGTVAGAVRKVVDPDSSTSPREGRPAQTTTSPGDGEPGGKRAPIPAAWDAPTYINMALQTKTLANLRRLSTACQVHMSENDEMPERIVDIVERYEIPPEETRDGWARPIRYVRTARFKFRLSSDGPDGRPDTGDDIVMENGSVMQGEVQMPGAPTLRQQRGLDPPPPPPEQSPQ